MKTIGKVAIVLVVLLITPIVANMINLLAIYIFQSLSGVGLTNQLLFISIPMAIVYGMAAQSLIIRLTNMGVAKIFNWIYTLLVFGFLIYMQKTSDNIEYLTEPFSLSLLCVIIFIGFGAWLRLLKIIDNRFKQKNSDSDILDMK
ncbi:hypothetical protein [Marinigracilibium pacificum]|uniref:DUF3021 domain-containing protein n=1 Tax=Marinigracilibium pacificum TaxID=2729599 RepID=A0A848J4V5_9BACT|nr:hypothetical protein [Marinigracilibium pacificum]NMM50746.1 hypothetical protein [Marinigracilibium pacificum]